MNSPQAMYILRWLIRDTFCQAWTTRIFWIMLGFSCLCIIFCLGVSVAGGDNLRPEGDFLYNPKTDQPLTGATPDLGQVQLLFGMFRVNLARDREGVVQLIQVILASWVAGAVGLLVTLVWTAGFVPESLQPGNASVLFAKPFPRWFYLAGKYLGVICLLTFQASIFFVGTWLALGLRTGVWGPGYLAGLFLLVLHFASIYSVSVFLGVVTGSTVAAALGSILFWMLCLAVNYGRDAALALPTLAPQTDPLSPVTLFILNAGYWILPKPADFIIVLENALGAHTHMATLSTLPEFAAASQGGSAELSIVTAILFTVAVLAIAGRQLAARDY